MNSVLKTLRVKLVWLHRPGVKESSGFFSCHGSEGPQHSPDRGWRGSSEHRNREGMQMLTITEWTDHSLFEEPLKILQLFDVGQLPVDIGLFRDLDLGSILVRSAECIEG